MAHNHLTPDRSRDAVIEALAMSEATLRAQCEALIDLVADLTLENMRLRAIAMQQIERRIKAHRQPLRR